MSDKEILEVLKEMLADYEGALIFIPDSLDSCTSQFQKYLQIKNLDFGFCRWLNCSVSLLSQHEILENLKVENTLDNFWFPTSIQLLTIEDIKGRCLMPRALLLNVTIERIEKRMLENITVTMPQQI